MGIYMPSDILLITWFCVWKHPDWLQKHIQIAGNDELFYLCDAVIVGYFCIIIHLNNQLFKLLHKTVLYNLMTQPAGSCNQLNIEKEFKSKR